MNKNGLLSMVLRVRAFLSFFEVSHLITIWVIAYQSLFSEM